MSTNNTFEKLLTERPALVADGAMGTSLFELGLDPGGCPELLNAEAPETVGLVHRGFIKAGSDIVLTNTFGANTARLSLHRYEDRVAELNKAGVALARAVVDEADRGVVVAGSVGPTGSLLAPLGELTRDQATAIFDEQMTALEEGGVDVIWIETMSSIEELGAAYDAASTTSLPIVATMSFDTHGRTMMGVAPSDLRDWAARAEMAAVGANCGLGLGELAAAVHGLTAQGDLVTVAKGNCGVPAYTEGRLNYPATPQDVPAYAELALRCGARIIGLCCGSTADHVAEIRTVVDEYEPAPRPSITEIQERLPLTQRPSKPSQQRSRRRRVAT